MKSTLYIKDKIDSLKNEGIAILENCRTELREMNQTENEQYCKIKNEIKALNKELESINRSLSIDENENNNIINKENKRMKKEFRLISTINAIANNRSYDEVADAVINKGIDEMRKAGVNYSGQIVLPMEELRTDITVSAEGEDVVATDVFDILAPLRAKNVLVNAGAKFLSNLVGDVQVPVMSAANVSWEGETTSATDAGVSFSNVKLTPKRLTAYVDVSKQFLTQTSASAEAMLRADLVAALNSKLEATILGATAGTTTKPAGLFTPEKDDDNKDIALTKLTSFADVCDLEAEVEDENVIGECAYIVSNKAKAALRTMAKSTKSTELVMQGGEIDGTKVYSTSNVAGTGVAYGDFSQLAIGQWGSADLVIDPFSLAKESKIRIVINSYWDAKLLRPNAVKVATV